MRGIDADLRAFVQNAAGRGADGPITPKTDRVLYVGMNDDSKKAEADGLRATGAEATTVLRREGTTVRLDGRNFDLASNAACAELAAAFGKKYGLAAEAQSAVASALKGLPISARDELARIAMVLAPGEKGAPIPSRLVFSGHSDGTDVHMRGESRS